MSELLLKGYYKNLPKHTCNFLAKNKEPFNLAQSRTPRITQWEERSFMAEMRRSNQEGLARKMRIAYLIKWDFYRKKRGELLQV